MGAKKSGKKNATKKRGMSRGTKIRKRFFGVTSLILAVLVANIPVRSYAEATEAQLKLTYTQGLTDVNWKIDLSASEIPNAHPDGGTLNVVIKNSSTAPGDVVSVLNRYADAGSGSNVISGKETIETQYTDAKIYDIHYYNGYYNPADPSSEIDVTASEWTSDDDVVVLTLEDLDVLVPASKTGGFPTTEDWHIAEYEAKYGSASLILVYNSGTDQWELSEGQYKPAIGADKKYSSCNGIKINRKTEQIAIAYREQVEVKDGRDTPVPEAHAAVVHPADTDPANYEVIVNSSVRDNDTGGNSLRRLVEDNYGIASDEDYYEFHMAVSELTTPVTNAVRLPDPMAPGAYLQFAVSIPLPDYISPPDKGTARVYLLRHDGNGANRLPDDITNDVVYSDTATGNKALQFETSWFDDVAIVFKSTVPRYTVTVSANDDGGEPKIVSNNSVSKIVFANDDVEIKAGSKENKRVHHWTVNGVEYTEAGRREQFTLRNVQEDKEVVAFYEDDTDHKRNVTAQRGNEGGNPSLGLGETTYTFTMTDDGAGNYAYGSDIEVYANPETGSILDYWVVNGERIDVGDTGDVYGAKVTSSSTDKLVLNPLTDDVTVIAYYKVDDTPQPLNPHTITLKVTGGTGTATVTEYEDATNRVSTTSADVTLTVEDGHSAAFTQTAGSGYTFIKWLVEPETGSGWEGFDPYDLLVQQNYTVTAVFGPTASSVDVTIIPTPPTGGTVSFNGNDYYPTQIRRSAVINESTGVSDDDVRLYAAPVAGYTFTGWSTDGPIETGGTRVSTDNPFRPTISGEITYYANFSRSGYDRNIVDRRSGNLAPSVKPTVAPNSNLEGTDREVLIVSDNLIGDIDAAIYNQGAATSPYQTADFNLQLYYTTDGTTPQSVVDNYNYGGITVTRLPLPAAMATRGTVELWYLDPDNNRAYEVENYSIVTEGNGRVCTFTMPTDNNGNALMTDYAFVQSLGADDFVFDVKSSLSAGTPSVTPTKPDPLPGDRTLTISESESAKNNALPRLDPAVAYDDAIAYSLRMTDTLSGDPVDDVGNVTVSMPLPSNFDRDKGSVTAYIINAAGVPVPVSASFSTQNGLTYVTLNNTDDYNDDYLFLFLEEYTFRPIDLRTRYKPTNDSSAKVTQPADYEDTLPGHRRVLFQDTTGSDILPLIQSDNRYNTYDHVIPYDISYTDENYVDQSDSEFQRMAISLTIPDEEMRDLILLAYNGAETGSKQLEEISFQKSGNILGFSTTHFSDYAILYNDPPQKVKIYISVRGNGSVLYENQAVTEVELDENTSAYLVAVPSEGGNRFVGWEDASGNPVGNPATQAAQSFGVGDTSRYLTAVFESTSSTSSGTSGSSGASGGTSGASSTDSGNTGGGGGSSSGTSGTSNAGGNNNNSGTTTSGGGTGTTTTDNSGSGATDGKGSNSVDMPRTGSGKLAVYKMTGVPLLAMFGVIELLSTTSPKKRGKKDKKS